MNALHGGVAAGGDLAGTLIGFTMGLLLAVVLLVLTLRAARLPGTPAANVGFAICALLWTLGGLLYTGIRGAGYTLQSSALLFAQAVHYAGAATSPIPVLAIWHEFAREAWRRTAARVILILASLSAGAIVVMLCLRGTVEFATHFTPYHAGLFLLFGAAVSLRRASTPRSAYLPSLLLVLAVFGAIVTMNPHIPRSGLLEAIGAHFVLLVILCEFLLFARFRYADVFIRYGVRILLAGIWAAVVASTGQSFYAMQVAHRVHPSAAVHVGLIILCVNAVLLSFTFVDDRLASWLTRWLFRSPDYRACLRQFAEKLRHLDSEPDIETETEEAARVPMELGKARVLAIEALSPGECPVGIAEGEIAERNFEVWVPIAAQGRIGRVLIVSPGPARPALVSHDLNYLRALAAQTGNRFDALRREREAIELQSREAVLQQQVSEAELRALRAQINPHFLFNSLNTIADLIVRNPARAEAMTVRLAGVFRHVLANSSRPLTTLRDEIEFLRTYLYIEEARFGDRLTVHMDIAPDAAGEMVPSLILQPLVENALKHGLAPKPGPGHLWISARMESAQVRILVEDDGMGPDPSPSAVPGLGLANVAERLATLYQDRASIKLEVRDGGGSRVTLVIPCGTGGTS